MSSLTSSSSRAAGAAATAKGGLPGCQQGSPNALRGGYQAGTPWWHPLFALGWAVSPRAGSKQDTFGWERIWVVKKGGGGTLEIMGQAGVSPAIQVYFPTLF